MSYWSETDKDALRTLVSQERTLLEMAKALNRPKNAIAGMMSRLGLKSQSGRTFTPHERPKKRTYKAKDFLAERQAVLDLPAPTPKPVLTLVQQEKDKDPYGSWSCQWPIGHPNAEEFRFCGDTRKHAKPYCQAHCDIAYHKPQKGTGRPFIQRPRILAQALETLEAE